MSLYPMTLFINCLVKKKSILAHLNFNLKKFSRFKMSGTIVNDITQIYKVGVAAVLPHNLISSCVNYNKNNEILNICEENFNLQDRRVFVVGAGKAVQYMAKEIEEILGQKIKKGIISIPVASLEQNTKRSNISYCEGAKNNLPDAASMATAKNIKELATSLTSKDVLIVLISGGGSALLPLPTPPITLEEKTDLIKKLANSGADIKDLNTVRKRISDIKGGKLAISAHPASVIALILSDVVGDPIELIASGPTVQDTDDPAKATNIIKKFNLFSDLPNSIKEVLENNQKIQEFPSKTKNFIIGSNKLSLTAAQKESEILNYFPILVSNNVTGNVRDLAKDYAFLARAICTYLDGKIYIKDLKQQIKHLNIEGIDANCFHNLKNDHNHLCLILGGEPTVEVRGTGLGGRNQQLALEFSSAINEVKNEVKNYDIVFLSAGTDGIDGPTDAAGAIGYINLVEDSLEDNVDIHHIIQNNDSYNFYKNFKNGSFHVIIGHTNTNVMDLHLIIIQKH